MNSDKLDISTATDQSAQLKRALLSLKKMRSHLEATEHAKTEPIAIIGMSCRFPGAVNDPDSFWQLLHNGTDAITEIPSERWDVEAFYDPDPDAPGKMYTRSGGFLQDIDRFDASFFGISPREALSMDPHQRILLEMVWEGLERAGIAPDTLFGSQTGVYISIGANDYLQIQKSISGPTLIDAYFGIGSAPSVAAGRLSYTLGLHGPCMAVDTACSSSLVTVHLACQALRNAECNMAVIGAANLVISPEGAIYFSRLRALAADGRCKTFDARADGYVRGEGGGVVILKRLSDAQEAGDPILALIRGSAVNQDGRSNGLTAPNGQAQEAVLRQALAAAHLKPEQIDYVEAHGTGTSLGDPIEMRALGAVLGEGRSPDKPFRVGSVKTNIGHLEAVAGIAGLIKTVLALQHEEIPPHLHLQERNPYIPWDDILVHIPTTNTPWPSRPESKRYAGVSAFGVGGTNAHVILEDAPIQPVPGEETPQGGPYLLPLSARTPQALRAQVHSYENWLRKHAKLSVHDICANASHRRSHHGHRLAVVGRTHEDLTEQLQAFLQGNLPSGASVGEAIPGLQREIVFMCPGQGSQWQGMCQGLLQREAVFRNQIEHCAEAMQPYLDCSLLELLQQGTDWQDIALIQPALFAIQVSLAALWRSWGIHPDAVVGHSMGEIAAACIAGILPLSEGARIICERSRLLRPLRGKGAMLLLEASQEQAQTWLRGHEQQISLAVSNSPRSSVLAGEPAVLEQISQQLTACGVFWRWIKVDVASHSPQVEPLRRELLERLQGLQGQEGEVLFYSTVRGERIAGRELDAEYWMSNLREPVQFARTIQRLLADGYDTFLELSPHPLLTAAIQENLALFVHQSGEASSHEDQERPRVAVSSLRRNEDEREMLFQALGTLYVHGIPIDWTGLYARKSPFLALPTYPFQRERFWIDASVETLGQSEYLNTEKTPLLWHLARTSIIHNNSSLHPLLRRHMASSLQPGTYYWECELTTHQIPYLLDHRVQGEIVIPAATYVEGVLAAATEIYNGQTPVLEQVRFVQMLKLPSSDETQSNEPRKHNRRLQIVFETSTPDTIRFQCLSTEASSEQVSALSDQHWILHVEGNIRLSHTEVATRDNESLEKIRERCLEEVSIVEYYTELQTYGLEYGPDFQGIERLWRHDGEVVAQLHLPLSLVTSSNGYLIHPALLDACLQAVGAATPRNALQATENSAATEHSTTATYLPAGAGQIALFRRPSASEHIWCHVVINKQNLADVEQEPVGSGFNADIWVVDESGEKILTVQNLRLQRLVTEQDADRASNKSEVWRDWLYQWRWQPYTIPVPTMSPTSLGIWLLFVDSLHDPLAKYLQMYWQDRGMQCVFVLADTSYRRIHMDQYQVNPLIADDFYRLIKDACEAYQLSCQGIVYLWGVTEREIQEHEDAMELEVVTSSTGLLYLVQSLTRIGWRDAPRLWLVTRGVHLINEAESPPIRNAALIQSSLWGLGRSIACEHPEFQCACVDLGVLPTPENNRADAEVTADVEAERAALAALCWSNSREDQIALRGQHGYVARLAQWDSENVHDSKDILTVAGQQPFRLEMTTPGILDNLTLRAFNPQPLSSNEVEIAVMAASLNFIDVLQAMGVYPGQAPGSMLFGSECAGRITAIGEEVKGMNVGDEVIAIAQGSIGTGVRTPAEYVVHKPEHLSFTDAAAIPAVFMTAYYALHHLARLAPGERILIHSASGGTGLAAIQIAQQIGAEIFVTAGTPEKRAFLRSLGIQHVMSSRSVAFADEIMEITNGQGVDVVLNSLTGEALVKSLSLLGSYGRFLEIGKKDIYQNSALRLFPFRKNLSYFAIDMAGMARERPQRYTSLLHEVVQQFNKKTFHASQQQVFPISEMKTAFHLMAQAKHTGKIVISLQDAENVLIAGSTARIVPIHAQATYLITGGLGGLGRTVARWMVEQGARHIVIVSRKEPSVEAREAIYTMIGLGAQIVTRQVDVTQQDQMAAVFAEIERDMPPLRGVIHCAAVLDDGVLSHLNQGRMQHAIAPKVAGAWNIHYLTRKQNLDFFVLFSSAASLLGSPGQGNYSTANAFLDALAHYRRTHGLPALSINWGPWSEVGLAAAQANRGERIALRGMTSISPEQGTAVLGLLLSTNAVQIGVVSLNFRQWLQSQSGVGEVPLLKDLLQEQSEPGTKQKRDSHVRETLLTVAPEQRKSLLEAHVREQIALVLRLPPTSIEASTALGNLGFDSLMAMELRNRFEASLGLTLSATLVWSYRTVGELVRHLGQKIELSAEPRASQQPSPEAQEEQPVPDADVIAVKKLSRDTATRLLLAELDNLPAEFN